ncbi:uncharacterized protein C8R40DRAFT_1072325 [Lentinula edodes]|uniref:uncharacterized protein n=1 Tax=Lentinula edodes TaxID=5353 RepID=UPI001E8CB398|nr:uncharacterized protein C8R40DRAFT_1072325 [Lentinula edodes]KAH7871565.1 hypothetical protein C8R40DRAFT_1072325 [Lentinula edodes]
MSITAREEWYDYEYHRGLYTEALERFELRPHDPLIAYEMVWAYSMAETRTVPVGAIPLAAFPLESYDLLPQLPTGTLSTLPRVAVATAISWNPGLLQKLAFERERPVVILEEGNGEAGSRTVVYFGSDQWERSLLLLPPPAYRPCRFFSFATLLRAVTFVYEFWHTEPSHDHCDGTVFGNRWLRDNLVREYERGADHWEGIERGWSWLGNV